MALGEAVEMVDRDGVVDDGVGQHPEGLDVRFYGFQGFGQVDAVGRFFGLYLQTQGFRCVESVLHLVFGLFIGVDKAYLG